MDSWMEEKLNSGSLTITLVSAKSTWEKKNDGGDQLPVVSFPPCTST